MRKYLEQTESTSWSIEIVPGANHAFMPSDFCESDVERRWADGFWEAFNNETFWSLVE